jgi:hypothetical protein
MVWRDGRVAEGAGLLIQEWVFSTICSCCLSLLNPNKHWVLSLFPLLPFGYDLP